MIQKIHKLKLLFSTIWKKTKIKIFTLDRILNNILFTDSSLFANRGVFVSLQLNHQVGHVGTHV